jgi:parvulin-like peptidyl-prolyl isomerase
MRSFYFSLLIFINISLQFFPQSFNSNELAIVGSQKILTQDFITRYSDYLFSTGIKDNPAVRQAILEGMINELLLNFYDDNSSIYSNEEYIKEINWVSKQSPLTYLKEQEIYAKITVTDEELRTTFVRVNEQLSASHLYAQTLEEAEYLYNLVQMGVDWDNLAAQVFSDSVLRNNGGYLGSFTWGDMDPAFEEAAYNLKVGEISKPVQTKNGYSIIRLENRVSNPLLTEYEFQNKKSKLESALKLKKKFEYEKKYIDSIFNESKYSLNQQSLDNIIEFLQLSDIEKNESSAKISDKTVAVKYDDMNFTEQFIVDQLNRIPEYHRTRINSSEVLKVVVKGIVMQQLLYREVIEKSYDKVPAVVEMTNKIKKQVFLKYKMHEVLSLAQVTDSSLKIFYNKNPKSFKYPNEISIQEILVENKSKADSIYKLFLNGEDFGKLAKTFSLRKASANNDGVIDYSDISKFGSIKKQLWQTDIGNTIGPIEVYGYYGIFKVLGKRDGKQKPFNDVKADVESLYKFENKKLIIENYLEKIKQKVDISVNGKVLSSINFLEKDLN